MVTTMRKNIYEGTASIAVKGIALILLVCGMVLPAHAQNSQYVLEAGDQIYIQVFDEPDLTM